MPKDPTLRPWAASLTSARPRFHVPAFLTFQAGSRYACPRVNSLKRPYEHLRSTFFRTFTATQLLPRLCHALVSRGFSSFRLPLCSSSFLSSFPLSFFRSSLPDVHKLHRFMYVRRYTVILATALSELIDRLEYSYVSFDRVMMIFLTSRKRMMEMESCVDPTTTECQVSSNSHNPRSVSH